MYQRQGRLSSDNIPPFEPNLVLTFSEQVVEEFERFGINRVSIGYLIDYAVAKFDVELQKHSEHLANDKEIKRALQYTQNTSVFLFLVLVHVPLTKVSAAWSFCTCFVVWLIDSRTKETVYHMCAFISRVFFSPA